jgi:predicted metal-dependent hydrolase
MGGHTLTFYVSRFTPYHPPVSKKSAKIAALIESCRGREQDAHYLGYFECFNQGLFYEAHDVLEELWLAQRRGANDAYYKGLIQFAGAFVHLQKDCVKYPRLRPSAALFKLARTNLSPYAPRHEALDVGRVLATIEEWLARLEEARYELNPLSGNPAPTLRLEAGGPAP